jgi:Yip1-like protein
MSYSPTASPPQSLPERAWNLLVNPREEWTRIAAQHARPATLFLNYAVPMMGLSAAASFLQRWLVGTWVPLAGHVRAAPAAALGTAVASFLFGLIGLFALALVIHLLAPAFGATRSLGQALKAAVYSATAGCVASVLWLLPTLGTLAGLLLMLYGIYLLYLGLIPVMSTPKERAAGYTATIIAVTFLAGLLMGMMGAAARPVITGGSIPDTTRLAP